MVPPLVQSYVRHRANLGPKSTEKNKITIGFCQQNVRNESNVQEDMASGDRFPELG